MVIVFVALAFLLVAILTAAYAGLRAAPWLPVRAVDVPRVIGTLGLKSGQTFFDLGCGDGRILLAVPSGVRSVGFELSVLPFLVSRFRTIRRTEASVKFQDFFRASFAAADAIFCFLTPSAMAKLAPKFREECRPDCRIVSYAFSIPGWTPERVDRSGGTSTPIFLYQPPERA